MSTLLEIALVKPSILAAVLFSLIFLLVAAVIALTFLVCGHVTLYACHVIGLVTASPRVGNSYDG